MPRVCVLVMLLVVTWQVGAVLGDVPVPQGERTREATSDELNDMPDPIHDVKADARLKCGACYVVTTTLSETFHALYDLKRGHVDIEDVYESLETHCQKQTADWGLQLRNNKPTENWSRDDSISRARGSAISVTLHNVCSNVFENLPEDELYEIWVNKNREQDGFGKDVCARQLKYCDLTGPQPRADTKTEL